MGIFNQQPNYNQSYSKEKRGITGPQGPPGAPGPAGAQGNQGPKGDRGIQGTGFNLSSIGGTELSSFLGRILIKVGRNTLTPMTS